MKEIENRENIPLRTFMVPVAYECYGRVPVTGRFKNAKEVLQYADEHSDEFNLPSTAEYLDESFEVDMDGVVLDEHGNEVE